MLLLSLLPQGFYEEVASTLLLDVDFRYPDNTVDFLTNNHFNQLFNGSEIVVAGRLSDNDMDNFMVEVFGKGVRQRSCSGVITLAEKALHSRLLSDLFL